MRKINSKDLLQSRATAFESYLGRMGECTEGKIHFLSASIDCALTLYSRRSIMSVNHFLSLQGTVPLQTLQNQLEIDAKISRRETACCYLSRFGRLKVRGKDPLVMRICERMREDAGLIDQLRQTHLDSLQIRRKGSGLAVMTNLYGGGYSATMLPPSQFGIGISSRQIKQGAGLFNAIMTLLASELQAH